MENSTVHNDQVTGLDAEDLFIQTDQSAAGFNIDQFHLVMPVVVEGMEDFAVVCISFYGKFKGAVRVSFFESVIYFNRGSWHGKSPFLKYDIKNVAEIYVWNNAVYMIIEPGVLFVL